APAAAPHASATPHAAAPLAMPLSAPSPTPDTHAVGAAPLPRAPATVTARPPIAAEHGPPTNSSPSTGLTALPLPAPAEASVQTAPVVDRSGAIRAHPWIHLAQVSLRRAFRSRIEPGLVLSDERNAMTLASPPIVDPSFQAFLAWRRSTLLVVAVGLALLSGLRIVELLLASNVPGAARAVAAIPVAADLALCAVAWRELGHWVGWYRQRQVLAIATIAAALVPLVIGLLPIRSLVGAGRDAMGVGLFGSMHALLMMVPITLALVPGAVRGTTVAKLLFPGAAAPGWAILVAAPAGGVLAVAVLVPPLQLTGSGFFAATVLTVAAAAALAAREGWQLARPLSADATRAVVARNRNPLIAVNSLAGVFAMLAVIELVDQTGLRAATTIAAACGIAIHVVLFALITTDAIVAALDHARRAAAATGALADDHQRQLAGFVGGADRRASPGQAASDRKI
ncbi:MAG: hypothetical protein K8W52_05115, partial [Deltaproteobacteria bacterium]|nr:hypothetical protein [Deltaproteobacteria bacterium]